MEPAHRFTQTLGSLSRLCQRSEKQIGVHSCIMSMKDPVLHIVSIGGGPGSDAQAVAAFLADKQKKVH
jgi:spermidine synthase